MKTAATLTLTIAFAGSGCIVLEGVHDPVIADTSIPSDDGSINDGAPEAFVDIGLTDSADSSSEVSTIDSTVTDDAVSDATDALALDGGACGGEGACAPTATRTVSCGKCGSEIDTCSSSCAWVAGGCASEGSCSPGTSETTTGSCASVGDVMQHSCTASCTWGPSVCVTPKGWRKMSASPLAPRLGNRAVWTGSEMIVWGGEDVAGTAFYADGARYNLATDTWKVIASPPAGFVARYGNAAAWTGSKMLVWGGLGATGYLTDGAIYDPTIDSWTAIKATTLSGRFPAFAYSTTTSDLLVWGSAGESALSDGAIYKPPFKDLWVALPPSPLSARGSVAFGWTGTQFMTFGGGNGTAFSNDGARYNPVTASWTALDAPPLGYVSRIWFGQGIVNGGLMIVGGLTPSLSPLADGLYFDASGKSQLVPAISNTVLATPERAYYQTWCDGVDRCWFWSGLQPSGASSAIVLGGGAGYSLVSKTWSSMSSIGEPAARIQAWTSWTGKSAIVWGGGSATVAYADGAIFTP